MTTSQPPTLYTTKQIAAQLGLSRQRIEQIVHRHQLGTFYGAQRLYTPEELDFIATRPDHRAIGLTNRWPATSDE